MSKNKNTRLGTNPLEWVKDTRKEKKKNKKEEKQKDSKTELTKDLKKEKVTYWIDEELTQKIRLLSVTLKRRFSDLITEGMNDLLEKYEKK